MLASTGHACAILNVFRFVISATALDFGLPGSQYRTEAEVPIFSRL